MPKNNCPRLLIAGKAYAPHIGGIETVMQQTAEAMRRYARVKVLCCRDGIGLTKRERVNGKCQSGSCERWLCGRVEIRRCSDGYGFWCCHHGR